MPDIINNKFPQLCFEHYLDYIHEKTGITIGKSRKTMVASRVRKRARELEIEDYGEYLNVVKNSPDEQRKFIDLITTNETYFYRTPEIWDYIHSYLVPEHYQGDKEKPLNVWSAASSTGEEAYTVSMLFTELKKTMPSLQFDIFASDISMKVLRTAKQGIYEKRAIDKLKKLKPELFDSYLKPVLNEKFRVIPEIKSKITFEHHNLFEPLKAPIKFDLILLRNVLIYFNKSDQEIVLNNIFESLSDNGVLIIGESESLLHLNVHFEYVMPHVYKPKKLIGQLV